MTMWNVTVRMMAFGAAVLLLTCVLQADEPAGQPDGPDQQAATLAEPEAAAETGKEAELAKPDKLIPMTLQAESVQSAEAEQSLSHQQAVADDEVAPGMGYQPSGGQTGGARTSRGADRQTGNAAAEADAQDGEQGFRVWTLGQGEVILGLFPAYRSAKGAVQETLKALGEHYGRVPTVTGALADDKDVHAEVSFVGQRGGQPVMGMLVCDISGGRTVIGIIDAPARQFPRMAGQLSTALQQKMPGGAKQVPLQRTRVPDGSGVISLPARWRIAAATNGMIDILGPDGQAISLGIFAQIYTPQGAANLMGVQPPTVAPWGPAAQVFPVVQQRLWNFAARMGSPQRQFVRVVETAPVAVQQPDQAIMVLYDWKINGQDYRTLGLFLMKPIPPGTWMYYHSSVSSPTERFAQDLHTMMRVWQSWKIDPRVGLRRLQKAMETMNTCSQIIQDVTANRAKAFDKAHRAWTEYIRNTATVIDEHTGEVREVDDQNLDDIIRSRNEESGYRRYRRIPVDELN